MFDFILISEKSISKKFQKLEINSFSEAMKFIKNLPYGRNSNRENFLLVLNEMKGTCSSKHALLKKLAIENQKAEVKLMLGIFRMNGKNTPKIKNTLNEFNLDYIPEAHNYLKIHNQIFDCTTSNSSELNFVNDLILEIEIQPSQVIDFKVEFHKNFLNDWIKSKSFSLEEIWIIREKCIADLSS
ncbi:hypothetical protein [Moheibacter sediminis]|uniref:Uncharacterized protein n=1 Tax=Moheibacter sediminis TaxID=1434700 RepID=A0A1W1YYK1_9FLAO|nr:hypothetical protein [Moheibacter sediminis]SMC41307.1 hypothetical protein SAMN06296427_10244 [Moheibacter sediminis]